MEAALTTIAAWLSFNLMLPPVYEHPRVELASLAKVEAYYDDATRTVYLPKGWTGRSPAELSVLVHEMVHHVQNVAGLTYCVPRGARKDRLCRAAAVARALRPRPDEGVQDRSHDAAHPD
jgi:hypothetical protein